MDWLIIGTGWISESFIKALRNNNENVLGVFSRTEEKGRIFAEKNNIENVITSLEDISDYDAVYIGTPNTVHYDQAKKVIMQGKHVMIEKPMTHSHSKTVELFELGKKHNVKVMEAYAHITHDEYKAFTGNEIKTNYMRESSVIKDGTYKTASSFSKELFGGALPDIGVYPLSAVIMILGKVISYEIKINKVLNDVIADCEIKLIHEKGKSEFRVSKLINGDNALYIDNKKVLDHLSFSKQEDRMDHEVYKFVNNKDLETYKQVSLETARVLEELLK